MNNKIICKECKHLKKLQTMCICEITCGNLDTFDEHPSWCPLDRNCHEYCRYGKYCRYLKGGDGVNPDDCAMSYKIEDLLNYARDVEYEQRKALDDYDEWE